MARAAAHFFSWGSVRSSGRRGMERRRAADRAGTAPTRGRPRSDGKALGRSADVRRVRPAGGSARGRGRFDRSSATRLEIARTHRLLAAELGGRHYPWDRRGEVGGVCGLSPGSAAVSTASPAVTTGEALSRFMLYAIPRARGGLQKQRIAVLRAEGVAGPFGRRRPVFVFELGSRQAGRAFSTPRAGLQPGPECDGSIALEGTPVRYPVDRTSKR